MKTNGWSVLPVPCASSSARCPSLRKDFLGALRVTRSPLVILDLCDSCTLNQEDVDLLLECLAHVAGRDMQLLLVTSSRVNRVLLDVTRIASLVPVFNSLEQALAYPQIAAKNDARDQGASQSQETWSA